MAAGRMIRSFCCYYLKRHCLLVGWIILNFGIFLTSYYHYFSHLDYFYLRKILGHGLCVSRGSAATLNLSCALVLLPVCKTLNSIIHRKLGRYTRFFLTCWFTQLKSIHITVALTIVLSSLVHSCGHISNAINFSSNFDKNYPDINWASYKGQSPVVLIFTSVVGVTGFLMLFLLILMVLLSTSFIRQLDYDLFWGSHFLFIVFLILFIVHPLNGILTRQTNVLDHFSECKITLDRNYSLISAISGNISELHVRSTDSGIFRLDFIDLKSNYIYDNLYNADNITCKHLPVFSHMKTQSWRWIAGPLLMYLIDIAIRILSRNYDNTFVIKNAIMLPGDVVSVTFKSVSSQKNTSSSSSSSSSLPSSHYNRNPPSQYVLVQCPKIVPLEWHPFTVVNSFQDKEGHFVFNLLIRIRGDWTRAVCHSSLKSKLHCHKPLRLLVDGPFFSPIQNVINSDVVICIAAGIGITPFAGILHHIIKENIKEMCQPFRIHLVWVIRTTDQLTWIQDLLTKLFEKLSLQNQLQRLDFHLYVTKDWNFERVEKSFVDKIANMGNVHLYFGRRPDWPELLSKWQQYYERGIVRVFLSGPPVLIDEVERVCHNLNRKNSGCSLKCVIESFS